MTIAEAIENNANAAFRLEREGFEDWAKSVRLGNEALKHIQYLRRHPFQRTSALLPGETKE